MEVFYETLHLSQKGRVFCTKYNTMDISINVDTLIYTYYP